MKSGNFNFLENSGPLQACNGIDLLCYCRAGVMGLLTYFLKIHLNIILPSTPGFSKWSLSLSFLHQNSIYTIIHTILGPGLNIHMW